MKRAPVDYSNTPEDWHDFHDANQRFRERRVWRAIIWGTAIAGSAMLAAALFGVGDAQAHKAPSGWKYPAACCSNRDCGEIPATAVKEGPHGFEVTILPGQHDMVKEKPVRFLIPYGKEKPSPDGLNHICLSPALKMLCFFTGSRGV